jgi:N-acetylglucosaminyl-diphospho-decaprenol L-rhamnosyltransferase
MSPVPSPPAPPAPRFLPVVIVHWNRPERCAATVAAFAAQEVPGADVVPLVVDNGSEPAARDQLRQALAEAGLDVEILCLGENRGFGPAANAGFRHVLDGDLARRARWIGLAPHDALPEPGCLAAMAAAVEPRPRAGLACADYGDGTTPMVDPFLGGILGPATVEEGWDPADHPHGTLMLVAADLLAEVGGFDERYFAYCEEGDLGLRARQAGWEVGLVRGALVRNPDMGHRGAAVDYLQLRNTMLLVREHSGAYHAFVRGCIAVFQLGTGVVSPRHRGPYFDAGARVRALIDHARGRYGPPPADLLAR